MAPTVSTTQSFPLHNRAEDSNTDSGSQVFWIPTNRACGGSSRRKSWKPNNLNLGGLALGYTFKL
jgi:hypothetical protein